MTARLAVLRVDFALACGDLLVDFLRPTFAACRFKDFFATEPLKSYLDRASRKKFERLSNLFRDRSSFVKSVLYRRYIAPQKCADGFCLLFWKHQRLICGIVIMRNA